VTNVDHVLLSTVITCKLKLTINTFSCFYYTLHSLNQTFKICALILKRRKIVFLFEMLLTDSFGTK